MKWLSRLIGGGRSNARINGRRKSKSCRFEALESRALMAADTLPVLMVIADRNDFYYQEYGDTRLAIEEAGLEVRVAATTTQRSLPHTGTGEPAGTDGGVTPDLSLAQVNPDDYSAIVFVGGWGSSMYQYAYNDPNGDGITDNFYAHGPYNGDDDLNDGRIAETKVIVNQLINDFLADDKQVAAVCHGVTVLAWARVDGVSPLAGKHVSVPFIGSPATYYQNTWYGYYQLGQYEQVVANGGIANTVSGQYGNTSTVADDVVVDGRIITAENYDSAREFGRVVAREVRASADHEAPPAANQPPSASDGSWAIEENSPAGTVVGTVAASDPDAGQTLTYAIVGGNIGGAFAIDSATGKITVANAAAVDFETTPEFHLEITVTDSGAIPLSDSAQIIVRLRDIPEVLPGTAMRVGNDLIARATSGDDTVYVWSGANSQQMFVWINGVSFGPQSLPAGGRVIVFGGSGNDQIYATDARIGVTIYGEAGHDRMTGGSADDLLDGGDGVDRIWGLGGNDLIQGGAGNDFLNGNEGHDIVLGGAGDDYVEGAAGRDLLFGGVGSDHVVGGQGDDLLIGGTTSYDQDNAALVAIRNAWLAPTVLADRAAGLATGIDGGIRLVWGETVHDDGVADALCGGLDADLLFASATDSIWSDAADLRV